MVLVVLEENVVAVLRALAHVGAALKVGLVVLLEWVSHERVLLARLLLRRLQELVLKLLREYVCVDDLNAAVYCLEVVCLRQRCKLGLLGISRHQKLLWNKIT